MHNNTQNQMPPTRIAPPTNASRPWWNRPLFGQKTFLQRLKDQFHRQEIPEGSIYVYSKAWKKAENIAGRAKKVDNILFTSEEFNHYCNIKHSLAGNREGYRDLNQSFQLLKGAVEAKNCFLKIEQIELRHRSKAQQIFYQFVLELLSSDVDKASVKGEIQKKLIELLPQIKTTEGKHAITAYGQQLNLLAQEHEFGLQLLGLFKKYQLADYSILKNVSDVVESISEQQLISHQLITPMIVENFDIFMQLGKIIQLPETANHPETYAKLLQVIGLEYRHSLSYSQFKQLLGYLQKWLVPYQSLISLQETYPATVYRQPPEFRKPIPGLELYQRYQKQLERFMAA